MISIAQPFIGKEELAAVERVLRSGNLAGGPEVASFEEEFSELVGGHECVATNSGTSALHLAMLAAGIGPGDEVIVPSFTFAATANAVALTGAKPVFADIDDQTYCLSPDSVAASVTARTAAIMPVHLYGQMADMNALGLIADKHGLALFEDACQAHQASRDGQRAGAVGYFGAFSFYPTKNMTAGEGGMVTTADPLLARKVRLLRNQGMATRYDNEIVGFNARMSDVHAAIGRVQLSRLPGWTRARQGNAATLDARLFAVKTPVTTPNTAHVFHQYTVRVPDNKRDKLANDLRSYGIGTGIYYPRPVHTLPAYALDSELPNTDVAAREVLSLPVHPHLNDADLARIAEAVNECMGRVP